MKTRKRRRLQPDEVKRIIQYHNAGYSVSSISKSFNIARSAIYRLLAGDTHQRRVDLDCDLPPLFEVSVTPAKPEPPAPTGLSPKYKRIRDARILALEGVVDGQVDENESGLRRGGPRSPGRLKLQTGQS